MEDKSEPELMPSFHLQLTLPKLSSARSTVRSIKERFYVKVIPKGPVWRRHLDQLWLGYGTDQDGDPGF